MAEASFSKGPATRVAPRESKAGSLKASAATAGPDETDDVAALPVKGEIGLGSQEDQPKRKKEHKHKSKKRHKEKHSKEDK